MSASLTPTWVIGTVDLTYEPFMVDRDNTVDIGEPETIIESLPSMLADGDNERVTRYGNRVYKIVFYIEGPTLADVAESEALLRRELRKPGLELTHNPGDGWSVDSVYEVRTAVLTPGRRDDHEAHFLRQFTLSLTCAPFARSAEPVTIVAMAPPAPTPTTATISNADTTTGFTSTIADYSPGTGFPVTSNPVTDQGAYAQANGTGYWLSLRLRFAPASPVSMATTPYLVVETSGSPSPVFRLTVNGVDAAATPVLSVATTAGTVKYVFDTQGGSLSLITIGFDEKSSTPVTRTINVHDISRTDTLPQVTTRQVTRVVEVLGTERTPASVHVQSQDGITNLGMTIVHTSPEDGSGYSPPLRRWRVSGAASPTTDASTMSGKREPITVANPFIAEVPNLAVPEGGYLLAARMRISSGTSATVNWGTSTQIDGVTEGYVTDYVTVGFPSTGSWYFVPIAALTLPSVRSYSGDVRVLLSSTSAELDEAWLFRVDDDCALTVVHNVTYPHMWLDSPDVTSSVPRIWIGDDAGRADASHPGANLFTHGNHTFAPDQVQIFAATSGTENPAVDLTYYPRWPNNAAS